MRLEYATLAWNARRVDEVHATAEWFNAICHPRIRAALASEDEHYLWYGGASVIVLGLAIAPWFRARAFEKRGA